MTFSLAQTASAETTLKAPAEADQNLRDITELACYICDAPVAMVTRTDDTKLNLIAKVGISRTSVLIKEGFVAQRFEMQSAPN